MDRVDPLFYNVVDRLKEAVQSGRSIDAAQVQVIGLEDIRRAAGADWETIKHRVRADSLSFLQGCLDRKDIVIPAGDGFLVIFNRSEERDLVTEHNQIRDALNAFYLGAEGMKALRATVEKTVVDPKGVVAMLSASQEIVASGPAAPARDMVFSPIWSVKRETVVTYFCMPSYSEGGVRRQGYDPAYRSGVVGERGNFSELDLRMIEAVAAGLTQMQRNGQRCIVGLSLHPSTMDDRAARHAALSRLLALPEEARKYLTVRIAEVESGTPLMKITDWVHQLRPISKQVSIELPPNERVISSLESTGVGAVGFFLPIWNSVAPATRDRCVQLMAGWSTRLHRQGIKVVANNINDVDVVLGATGVGVDFIAAPRFWPDQQRPGAMTAYPLARLKDQAARRAA